jgi:hypothetical protein
MCLWGVKIFDSIAENCAASQKPESVIHTSSGIWREKKASEAYFNMFYFIFWGKMTNKCTISS